MSLRTAVAVPFKTAGTDRLGEGEFVVALSLDRDWFSPDQAKRVVDAADGRGLIERVDGQLRATFEPSDVDVPEGFVPDDDVLTDQSTFERLIDRLVADGLEKRDAVAAANERQGTAGVTLETAAVLVARERGLDVDRAAADARNDLLD